LTQGSLLCDPVCPGLLRSYFFRLACIPALSGGVVFITLANVSI
ncbi:MAG: hypothetical protein ACJA04_001113, partial [Cellvibrionaceae bacterium]